MWEIEYDLIEHWLDGLDEETVTCVFAALEILQERGPALGRPLVDRIAVKGANNLKELRPASPGRSEVRILFAFDPRRKAVLLVGGDKSKGKNGKTKWTGWYQRAIPEAQRLFREHLASLEARE